ncbi:MAG: choice-of-anchor J domain-containing protein, partial [Bacteroidota bacterium]
PGIPSGWTVTRLSGTTATWSVVGVGTNPPIAPYAGSGQAKFNSFDASAGEQARFTSPPLNLAAATDPFLTFFMYHEDEYVSSLDSIYVEATTGDSIAGPWTRIAGYRRPRTVPGWKKEAVSLFSFSGANRLFVSFRGISQYGNNIYVDEVRIADSSFHDIGSVALLSPGSGIDASRNQPTNDGSRSSGHLKKASTRISHEMNEVIAMGLSSPLNFSIIIQNFGTFAEPSYQIRWQIDGQTQTAVNNARSLSRSGRDTLTLPWQTPIAGTHVITAWTSLNADSNRSNDTIRLTIAVLDTSVFFAEMFNGTSFPPSGWITVNRDGGPLPPWFQGSSSSIFLPYEGTGFAADNFQRANGAYIDDYLISPPIAGVVQPSRVDSLKFWVRSANNPPPGTNYPDSLMVLLSTTGADTSNFTILLEYFSVPKSGWTLKKYTLNGRVPHC